jgi:hypothetical protein
MSQENWQIYAQGVRHPGHSGVVAHLEGEEHEGV